jgi:type II secretory ATPase GspE/PulE/Tfp pilus assembly ATPase PilB-like protein
MTHSHTVAEPKPLRLGEQLVALGLVTQDQLRIALQEQKNTSKPLGDTLLGLGFIPQETIRCALAERLGEQSISLKGVVADARALALIPKALAKRHVLFPVSLENDELLLASADPNDIVAADQINALLMNGPKPRWALASSAEILSAIELFYGHELSIDGILHELESGTLDLASLSQVAEGYSHPVVRLIDSLLADATLRGASDLHFEPEPQFLRIRYRIDGVLRQVRALHMRFWSAMIVRLKVMAGMNIAETRAPQDGRMALTISGRQVNFRAAVQPTLHGENFVLRILDRKRGVVALDELGLSAQQLTLMQLMLSRPEGILLVTGPTGSGKTTTLYSILAQLNQEGVNIMTLEDPVEYSMPLIRQTSLSDGVKMDFAEGIRSMMRQDPDIILVGEIRDHDTAEMAVRAAMTGHQVFSTLHTNSAIRAIPRLLDLGIRPDVLAGNVIGIVAQRLVRSLCPHCKRPHKPDAVERSLLGLEDADAMQLFRPMGCAACEFQGYKGRFPIMELLKFDVDLDELVTQRASIKAMTDLVHENGFVAMAADGMRRVRDGCTTVEEIARVVDLTDWIR